PRLVAFCVYFAAGFNLTLPLRFPLRTRLLIPRLTRREIDSPLIPQAAREIWLLPECQCRLESRATVDEPRIVLVVLAPFLRCAADHLQLFETVGIGVEPRHQTGPLSD